MTTFSEPYPIGNAFGPGKEVVDCGECGAVVRPDQTDRHAEWHGALFTLAARAAAVAAREAGS